MKKKLIKQYFVSEIIKKPMTTRSDLEFLANKLDLDVKINWLKDVDVNDKGMQIINLGNPYGVSGSHWTCSYDGKYFDSFGLIPPQKFVDAGYEWVPLQLQGITEGFCGNWCILWLYYAKMNEIDRFYNLFQTYN